MDESREREESEGWEPETEEDWIFDLPPGAWERQESKNRELRDRLRRNLEEVQGRPHDSPLSRRLASIQGEHDPESGSGSPDAPAPAEQSEHSNSEDGEGEPAAEATATEPQPGLPRPPVDGSPWALPRADDRRRPSDPFAAQRRLRPEAGQAGDTMSPAAPSGKGGAGDTPAKGLSRLSDRWGGIEGDWDQSGSIIEGMRAWVEKSRARNEATRPASEDEAEGATPEGEEATPPSEDDSWTAAAGRRAEPVPEDDGGDSHSADAASRGPVVPPPRAGPPSGDEPPTPTPSGVESALSGEWEPLLDKPGESVGSPPSADSQPGREDPGDRGGPGTSASWDDATAGDTLPEDAGPWSAASGAEEASEAGTSTLDDDEPVTDTYPPSEEFPWHDRGEDDNVLVRALDAHAEAARQAESSEQADRGTAERQPEEPDFADIFGDEASSLLEEIAAQPRPFSKGAEDWGGSYTADTPLAPSADLPLEPVGGPQGGGAHPAPVERARGGEEATGRSIVRNIVETTLLALLVFLAVRASLQNFRVDGTSMSPTLEDGEFLLVNKLVYTEVDMGKLAKFVPFLDAEEGEQRFVFHGPERGDIVVLRDPRRPEQDLIKRVVGLPGETVEIRDGRVFINDRLLEEPYIQTPWSDTRPKIAIPEGHYYVLGDNRNNSLDSRSAQVGLIPKSLIIGKALLTYWPFDRFGLAPNSPGTSGGPQLTTIRIEEFVSESPPPTPSPDGARVVTIRID